MTTAQAPSTASSRVKRAHSPSSRRSGSIRTAIPRPPVLLTAKAPLRPFVPRRFLRNGHLQTVFGNFLPRAYSLPEPESQLIEVETANSDRGASFVLCHWQPADARSERLTMVIVHGLEGSSSSLYVLGNSARAWTAGCNVVRMNMRSCGANNSFPPHG